MESKKSTSNAKGENLDMNDLKDMHESNKICIGILRNAMASVHCKERYYRCMLIADVNKSNRFRTIDAFSSVHVQVFVLVFVLTLVPVLPTVA